MKYTKPWRDHWELGVGLVDDTPGMSFQPFDIHAILRRVGLLFGMFIVFPVFVGLAITVLQSIFPFWPR